MHKAIIVIIALPTLFFLFPKVVTFAHERDHEHRRCEHHHDISDDEGRYSTTVLPTKTPTPATTLHIQETNFSDQTMLSTDTASTDSQTIITPTGTAEQTTAEDSNTIVQTNLAHTATNISIASATRLTPTIIATTIAAVDPTLTIPIPASYGTTILKSSETSITVNKSVQMTQTQTSTSSIQTVQKAIVRVTTSLFEKFSPFNFIYTFSQNLYAYYSKMTNTLVQTRV